MAGSVGTLITKIAGLKMEYYFLLNAQVPAKPNTPESYYFQNGRLKLSTGAMNRQAMATRVQQVEPSENLTFGRECGSPSKIGWIFVAYANLTAPDHNT